MTVEQWKDTQALRVNTSVETPDMRRSARNDSSVLEPLRETARLFRLRVNECFYRKRRLKESIFFKTAQIRRIEISKQLKKVVCRAS
jgi:hypothetical protein